MMTRSVLGAQVVSWRGAVVRTVRVIDWQAAGTIRHLLYKNDR